MRSFPTNGLALIFISSLPLGPDKGAHYHELFLRSKRYLSHRILRTKIKGQGARKPAQPSDEPNLYSMPFLPPNPSPTKNLPNSDLSQQMVTIPMAPSFPANACAMQGLYAQLLATALYPPPPTASVPFTSLSLDRLLLQNAAQQNSVPAQTTLKDGVDAATVLRQLRRH